MVAASWGLLCPSLTSMRLLQLKREALARPEDVVQAPFEFPSSPRTSRLLLLSNSPQEPFPVAEEPELTRSHHRTELLPLEITVALASEDLVSRCFHVPSPDGRLRASLCRDKALLIRRERRGLPQPVSVAFEAFVTFLPERSRPLVSRIPLQAESHFCKTHSTMTLRQIDALAVGGLLCQASQGLRKRRATRRLKRCST